MQKKLLLPSLIAGLLTVALWIGLQVVLLLFFLIFKNFDAYESWYVLIATIFVVSVFFFVMLRKGDLKGKIWTFTKKDWAAVFTIMLPIALIFELLKGFVIFLITDKNVIYIPNEFQASIRSTSSFLPTLISLVLLIPFMEEIFFRRYIMAHLLKDANVYLSILLSSLLFAAFHFPVIPQMIEVFAFGVLSAFILLRSQKIMYCIILHMLVNLLWVGQTLFIKKNIFMLLFQ
jgi:membrane protease YdiL (CAAX protease family)